MRKKLFAILMSAMMMVSFMPSVAFAAVADTDVAQIGDQGYATLADAIKAANSDDTIKLFAGEYTTYGTSYANGKTLHFEGATNEDGTPATIWKYGKSETVKGEGGADYSFESTNVTFENVVFKDNVPGANSYRGFVRLGKSKFENCAFSDMITYLGPDSATFKDCTFTTTGSEYALWIYGIKEVIFDGCTMNVGNRFANAYIEGTNKGEQTIVYKDCTLNANSSDKSALNLKNSNDWNVYFLGKNTVTGLSKNSDTGSALFQVESGSNTNKVYVGATKDDAILVWNNGKTEQYMAPEEYSPTELEYVAMIGETGYISLEAAINNVQSGEVIVLQKDTNIIHNYSKSINEKEYSEDVGSNRLIVDCNGKQFTLDLNGKTLTGRLNLSHANMTVKNGTWKSSSQAINVFGTDNYEYAGKDYTVVTLAQDVTIDSDGYGVAVFGGNPNNLYWPIGFGERVEVYGKIVGNGAGIGGTGNLGMDNYTANITAVESIETLKTTTDKSISQLMIEHGPVVNIYDGAEVMSKKDCPAIYLPGCIEINVYGGKLQGTEAVSVKGGELNVYGGQLIAIGAKCNPIEAVNSGEEPSGAAVSYTSSYSANYPAYIKVSGGTLTSDNYAALLIAHSVDKDSKAVKPFARNVDIKISGGRFVGKEVDIYVENKQTGDIEGYPTTKFISAGTFSSVPATAYLADNAKVYKMSTTPVEYVVSATDPGHSASMNTWTLNAQTGLYEESYVAPPKQDPAPEKIEEATSIDVSKEVEVKKDETGVVAAKTEVSEKVAESIVEAAKTNKSEEVVIAAVAETKSTEAVTKAEVALPVKAIEELAKVDTVQTVVIQTNVAEIALDKKTAEEIAKQAPEGATIIVEAVREDEKSDEVAQDVYELKIIAVQSGTKTEIGDFKGGKVTVKVDIPEGLTGKKVACLYRDNNGKYTRRAVTKQDDAKGFFSFTTNHFSDYVVTEEATAQKLLVNQTEENQKKLKANANGKIKVSFDKVTYDTELGKRVQTYQIYRSTKKNSGFKKVGTVTNKKKSTKTITFTNAKKLKKGKKYYYKVRGRVQLANGKYAYTQWSNVRYAKCKKSR